MLSASQPASGRANSILRPQADHCSPHRRIMYFKSTSPVKGATERLRGRRRSRRLGGCREWRTEDGRARGKGSRNAMNIYENHNPVIILPNNERPPTILSVPSESVIPAESIIMIISMSLRVAVSPSSSTAYFF